MLDNDGMILENYRSYLKILAYGLLTSYCKARVDESDIAQIVIINAHNKRNEFKGDSSIILRAWLRKILVNTVKNEIKFEKREKRNIDLELSLDQNSTQLENLAHSFSDDPNDKIQAEELLLKIEQVITSLPEDQRNAFILVTLDKMKTLEAAEMLGKTRHSVGGLVKRALKTLRAEIDTYLNSSKS